MKLSKFLLFVTSFTFFSLLYVYQQSEIFRLAYLGEKRILLFEDLLEKNTILRYNIEASASLTRIGNKLSSAKDYEMPGKFQLVRLSRDLENTSLNLAPRAKKQNMLVRFFSVKREAQAKTVNP